MAEIKVAGKLIPTPSNGANIYRLKSPNVTEKSVRALARQLGMRADAKSGRLSSDADKLSYVEEHLELTIYRASGGVRLIDRSRWQIDDRKSDLLITDEVATRLAMNLIKKNKFARTAEVKFLKAARLRVGEATKDGENVSERTIDVAVAMQRLVDKIPVDGPGGKIIVYFDSERNLSGMEKIWRDIGGVHRCNQPWRPAESALDEMAAHFRTKQGIIEIQEMRYGYFEDGWRTSQQYLQPAYVIFGMLTSPDGRIRKRTIYVAPALVNAVGRITPPLQRKPSQRARPLAPSQP